MVAQPYMYIDGFIALSPTFWPDVSPHPPLVTKRMMGQLSIVFHTIIES